MNNESLSTLIKTRRTVHQYKPQTVPDDLVKKALELSLWAPNHRLTYPWRYFMVSEDQRKRFIDLAVELKRSKDSSFSQIKEVGLRKRLGDSSHWIALGIKKDSNPGIFQEDLCTLACSVQIISLSLWEQGVSTKWSTGGFSTHPKSYEILGANPDDTYLMGALFVGYADVTPPTPQRPPLSEFLIEGK